jgi:hypothetical protein
MNGQDFKYIESGARKEGPILGHGLDKFLFLVYEELEVDGGKGRGWKFDVPHPQPLGWKFTRICHGFTYYGWRGLYSRERNKRLRVWRVGMYEFRCAM